ncbi:hypothetical protein [Bacillus alkalicellulosilyticus]|nr:hypothetical protein [Bacillus alkalicellulosilyticus]
MPVTTKKDRDENIEVPITDLQGEEDLRNVSFAPGENEYLKTDGE